MKMKCGSEDREMNGEEETDEDTGRREGVKGSVRREMMDR